MLVVPWMSIQSGGMEEVDLKWVRTMVKEIFWVGNSEVSEWGIRDRLEWIWMDERLKSMKRMAVSCKGRGMVVWA